MIRNRRAAERPSGKRGRALAGRAVLLGVLLILPSAFSVGSSETQLNPVPAETLEQRMVNRVYLRLLAASSATPPPKEYLSWPPKIQIYDTSKDQRLREAIGTHNAFASAPGCVPELGITVGLIKDVIQNDDNRLAFVLGHEFGHLLLKHTKCKPGEKVTGFVDIALTREQEYAADRMGMELALAGGYSARQGLRAYQRMDELWGRSSFHSLTSDHPSSKDRLAQMDKEQAPLWRAMSAFEDGVCFLAAEQYAAAGASFSMVTREFPQSHEAWANLGYAKLMMYADGLETADLRKLGVPHIAVGGFYARPASLQAKVRGINRALWQEALSALQNADRLNPNQALVKANLGVAYLVSPDGPDAARAVGYLRAAINLATSDPPLPALGLTAITANHAAAVFLSGTDPSFPLLLKSVELAWKGIPERAHAFRVMTASSLLYTSAAYQSSVRTQESAEAAVSNYEEYLQITHPASAWWPLAYERYTAAAAQVGQKPKPKEAFATPLHQIMRELTTVNLAGGRAVVLGQPVEELRKQFPQATRLPAFQGSNLARYRLDTGGADVLADDRVLAIVLNSASSPPVPVQSMGVSGRGVTLRVSMTEDALDALLKDQDFNFQTLLDRRIPYRFYPYLGLGVKVDNGVVKELLIVRIPRQS